MQNKQLIKGLCITALLITTYLINNYLDNKQLDKQIQEYKQCILKQSQEQGYIIRHYCSSNYQILDQLSGLQYTQKGYNLYLKQ
mgnify:CR=1 FL=1